jgi:hypothetical protein
VIKAILTKRVFGAVLVTTLISGVVGLAQAPATPPPAAAKPPVVEKPLVPLKVQVTIARYEGEKKTSSLPFTLWVNANDFPGTTLNVGIQVPIGSGSSAAYRSVGTNITCRATSMDDGRFKVNLDLEDSSVASSKDNGATPTFQSIGAHNMLLLRDGQNAQFIAATDKVSGEVTKVDVTLTVLK